MQYIDHYQSPMGGILLAADDIGLTGLWFEGQKYYARKLDPEHEEKALPVFEQTKDWLDIYFSGREVNFTPTLHMMGSDFQISVWEILQDIPYGKTMTYGEIAQRIAKQNGLQRMSAQAIGGAVGHNEISLIIPCHRVVGSNGSLIGHNEISLIIPCHRVVGSNGSLTGYAGGIDKKKKLLSLEQANTNYSL